MLKTLQLTNVGPAPAMKLELAPRLNLITGDNGLGKSFLLDVAWWALTRKWPQDLNANLTSGYAARPTDVTQKASIEFEVQGKTGTSKYESPYVADEQAWKGKAGRPWNPGLVIYALADGGFAVWDPARNYWRKQGHVDVQERLPAYVFSSKDVWDGLRMSVDGKPTQVSNGLVADWASWIREGKDDATRMADVLALLAPAVGREPMRPGSSFARLSVNDARDIPTVHMGYGQDVPILYASRGVRRIAALAYMLSWAWREHVLASKQLGQVPSSRIVLLFDEIEAHLHPRWQRAVVPALLQVVQTLTRDEGAAVQLIAATHSPLVLASVEPQFDPAHDKLFLLDIEDHVVTLTEQRWAMQGDVINWLVSKTFGLQQARSLEAKRAVEAAEAWMRNDHGALPADLQTKEAIHAELQRVLAGHDPFWPRWILKLEKSGGEP
ncbi:MAG: ATP-binding protein [Deltaproteobacteria bacterium]|nr:ATP-binding protein [Deltaproteobacteria bacterium]